MRRTSIHASFLLNFAAVLFQAKEKTLIPERAVDVRQGEFVAGDLLKPEWLEDLMRVVSEPAFDVWRGLAHQVRNYPSLWVWVVCGYVSVC